MTPYETYKKAVEEASPKPPRCCDCSDGAICFWHLQIKSLHSLTLALLDGEIERLEARKRNIKSGVDELGRPVSPTEAFEIRGEKGYNQALEDSLSYLRSEREKIANEK